MADYKKYAENLVGNWEKDIYAPQRQVTQDIYQTNWNKLSNDFQDLKDKLARNFDNARLEYSNALNNVQDSSFNRMNNANIDLANRGLSSSGMLDKITQADTQVKGQEVDKALASLLGTNSAAIEGLSQGVSKYAQKQTGLAGDLAKDLGELTGADAANIQQYGGLIAGIGESAAKRAASRAASGGASGLSKKQQKAQDELDEYYRKMAIYETLNDDTLSDAEKRKTLVNELNVSVGDAEKAISSTNYTNTQKKIQEREMSLNKLDNTISKLNRNRAENAANLNKAIQNNAIMRAIFGSDFDVANNDLTNLLDTIRPTSVARDINTSQIDKLNKKLNDYTYTDLYDLLYK